MRSVAISQALLLLVVIPLLHGRELRVNIYPWIPDLANDQQQSLINWIKNEFEALYPEIDLQVSTPTFDVYDLDELKDNLVNSDTAPHIVEVDTILLGEIADEGLIAALDPAAYGLNATDRYLPFTLEAVQRNNTYYAVPTYICGSYLMGINVNSQLPVCPVSNGVGNYSDLNVVLDQCQTDLLVPPRTMTLTGNFDGSWTLPSAYIDAYIDRYGADTVYDAIDSDISAETDVINNMRSFIEYCQTGDNNKCLNGEFGDITAVVGAVVDDRRTVTGYSYSEYIGAYLQRAINTGVDDVNVYDIIAPPLGPMNNFLMYTDALVVNRALLDDMSADDINTFINFYTSLSTRLSIAFGDDLPDPHPARYLMQARMDFYNTTMVENNSLYRQLSQTLQYAVAAPNNRLYSRRDDMEEQIINALGITTESFGSANRCDKILRMHPRDRDTSFEMFYDGLEERNETLPIPRFWQTFPGARDARVCRSDAATSYKINNIVTILFLVLACVSILK